MKNDQVKCYPNLLIIGAQKSGTTSLHKYLDEHPDVFMSKPIKEPGLYRDFPMMQRIFEKRGIIVQSQIELFNKYCFSAYKNERYVGESSTYYTIGMNATNEQIADRIREQNSATKIIYIVRHPIERLVSNYVHIRSRNYSKLSLNDYVITNDVPMLTSQYHMQLQTFDRFHQDGNILILAFEEMKSDVHATLGRVCDFLDLEKIEIKVQKVFNKATYDSVAKEELKFSPRVFKKISDVIIPDFNKFKEKYSYDLDYDFSPEKWIASN